MYIEFQHGPRAGQRAHVSREVGAPLIIAGLAKQVQMTEQERIESIFGKQIPAPPPTESWSAIRSPYTGAPLIQRRYGDLTALFDGPPSKKEFPNCPASVLAKFEEMNAVDRETANMNSHAASANRH